MDVATKLRAELDEVLAQADEMTGKDDFDPESPLYVELKARADKLQASYSEMRAWRERKAASDEVGAALHRMQGHRDDEHERSAEASDLGGLFVRSGAFQSYRNTPKGTSALVETPMANLLLRAPLTSTSGTGQPWVSEDRIGIAVPSRQTPLLDSVGRVRVNSNSVEWVTYPAAAPLAAVVGEGAQKPEATITASIVTVTLDTIAHYAEATRQLLEDSTAARDFINAELARGVLDKIEANIAAAIAAASIPPITHPTGLLEAIRVGIATVQSAGFTPNVVLLNPVDYASLDISVMGGTLLGPTVNGTYWGVRPVAVGALTAGTAYVMDAGAAVNYLERTSVATYITDSHGGNFTKNIFTFLSEARGKAVVTRPEAAAKVSKAP